jgi:hypothetical protein
MFRTVSTLVILLSIATTDYAMSEGTKKQSLAARIETLSKSKTVSKLSPELEKKLYSPLQIYVHHTNDLLIEDCLITSRVYPNVLLASDIIQKTEFDLRQTDLESAQKEIGKPFISGGEIAIFVFHTISPYKAKIMDRQVTFDKDSSPDVFINSFNEKKFITSYSPSVYFEMYNQDATPTAQELYDSLIQYKMDYCTPS